MSQLSDTSEMAKFYKVIAEQPTPRLGTLKIGSTHTKTTRETLKVLAATHFPGATEKGNDESYAVPNGNLDYYGDVDTTTIFDEPTIKWAISSFAPFKSAGSDNIFPALLQNCSDKLAAVFSAIFTKSYTTGYIPRIWRRSKVTYIPKPGRKPTDDPKSYSLFNLFNLYS